MTTPPVRAACTLALLCTAAMPAAALSYADVGTGAFGSMSWVARDYHFTSVTEYDGGSLMFLSGRADDWHLSYADAAMSGRAESSLFDGTLHVLAAADAWGPHAVPHASAYLAGAGTAMWDRVTLDADEGTHLIPLRLRVDGAIQDAASARVRYHVGAGDPFAAFARDPYQGWKYLNGNPGNTGTREWDTTFELGSLRIDGVHEPWAVTVYFEMEVTAYSSATSGGVGDFRHTARFSWELPEGLSAQSASGQFMTVPLPAVPEPSTAVLALLGIAALPALRRRQGAADATATDATDATR